MVEQDLFRAAMARLGAAVNIVTSDGPMGRYGLAVSAVCSVTDDPPTVLVCVNRASKANETFKANGVLCINVLAGRHEALSGRFSTPSLGMAERFGDETNWTRLDTGSPVLVDASVALDCALASYREIGTHSVFFCEVRAVQLAEKAEGLVYFNRSYHHLGVPVLAGASG